MPYTFLSPDRAFTRSAGALLLVILAAAPGQTQTAAAPQPPTATPQPPAGLIR